MVQESLDEGGLIAAEASESALEERRIARHELFSVLVLALATVLTAWAAFQATVWIGETDRLNNRASALRVESSREQSGGSGDRGRRQHLDGVVQRRVRRARREPGAVVRCRRALHAGTGHEERVPVRQLPPRVRACLRRLDGDRSDSGRRTHHPHRS